MKGPFRGLFGVDDGAERNLGYGLGEVRRIASSLGLGDRIRDQACVRFRKAHAERLAVGRSLEALAAATVYATCRYNGLGRLRTEIAACARCDEKRLTVAYRALNTELAVPTQPVSASDRIPSIAAELEVPERVRRRALEFAQRAAAAGVTIGCRPSGVAAACLYLAGKRYGLCLSQQHVADVAGSTPNTLRARRDELLELED